MKLSVDRKPPEMLPGDWQIRRRCPGFANPGRISDEFSIY
ncbi:Uncharacterized protein dnm_060140 [Desulfonema magnum]|uniref:Uncharacterized protein n=1 Tax=Desulfonema magnum TaxID=45655 RepID=A0A975GQJ0_9BACT|nr:Uncharacterized protein dnm_060140 [Desulfonema magnum]